MPGRELNERIGALDWAALAASLNARGNARVRQVLSETECLELAAAYNTDEPFRSRVVMSRHGFGRGEYKYFRYPLPGIVSRLREAFYPRLVPIANEWNTRMRIATQFPSKLRDFLARCRDAGQSQPTPLLLKYGAGDFNCLHQDLYGEHVFPLQLAILLSAPGEDFTGGELVMTEQRPRMQTRPQLVPLQRGDGVIFAVRHRPVQGTRGTYRVNMRHGVSEVLSGQRFTLGVIFHDAK